jgi:hypothetical protein
MTRGYDNCKELPERHPSPQATWGQPLDFAEASIQDDETFPNIIHGQALRHVAQCCVKTQVGLSQIEGVLAKYLDCGRHAADLVHDDRGVELGSRFRRPQRKRLPLSGDAQAARYGAAGPRRR